MLNRSRRLIRMGLAALSAGLLALTAYPHSVVAAQFINEQQGYTVTYPDTWTPEPWVSKGNRTVTFLSYPEQTPPGAFVRPGGAVIDLHVFPPYSMPGWWEGRDDYAALEDRSHGSIVIFRQDRTSGLPARVTRVARDGDLRLTETVRHIGDKTFLATLICEKDNPDPAPYEQVFDALVASVTLITPTPPTATPTPSAASPTP